MLKISPFYLEKQKGFIPKKCNLSRSLNRPREFQQMAFAVPIFSEGFGWREKRDEGKTWGRAEHRRVHRQWTCDKSFFQKHSK